MGNRQDPALVGLIVSGGVWKIRRKKRDEIVSINKWYEGR